MSGNGGRPQLGGALGKLCQPRGGTGSCPWVSVLLKARNRRPVRAAHQHFPLPPPSSSPSTTPCEAGPLEEIKAARKSPGLRNAWLLVQGYGRAGDVPFPSAPSMGATLHNPSLSWEMAILAFNCMLACSIITITCRILIFVYFYIFIFLHIYVLIFLYLYRDSRSISS